MSSSNLMQADALLSRASDPTLRLLDVRFDLADPAAGRGRYEAGHLPGAAYLHLDDDLSSPVRPDGVGGRHPLPDPGTLADRLGAIGVGTEHEVVAYDDAGGMIAARAWWLLRWLGHRRVRVLDGGVAAWTAVGGRLVTETPAWPPARFVARPDASMVVDADAVAARLETRGTLLIDARSPERYRGEVEPLDRVAGHVPGAINLPFSGNLEGGRFLAPDALRRRFAQVEDAAESIVYCGSGVTAAHDALAIAEAGLPLPRLYAGSWSDWSSRSDLPVATGDEAAAHGPHGGSA